MIRRLLFSIHRILGTILSILFVTWFLSGFVMIYHSFPKVTEQDKYRHAAPLSAINVSLSPDSVLKQFPEGNSIFSLSLKSFGSKSYYKTTSLDGVVNIPADTTNHSFDLKFDDLQQYALQWSNAKIIKIDTLNQLEQWIPFGYLKKDFPIYKFYFGDKAKSQLYLSSKTGEALQFTNNNSRFWAWLGPIPHWVYFTSLRQNSELWAEVLIWLSGIGCIMCITGLTIGIRLYIKQIRRKKKFQTPYTKFAYKWHHILSFIFGIFVFSFAFSGMMSLASIPQWLVRTNNPLIQEQILLPQPIVANNYKLDVQKVMNTYPQQIKSIEWSSFGNVPLYKIVVGEKLFLLNASYQEVKPLEITESMIKDRLSYFHKDEYMEISLMREYDNYYITRKNKLPLPVYKVEVADADNSTYYINPKNGDIQYFNNNSKTRKWSYQALHSYKIPFLIKNSILWNIIMWTTMLGGTLVSFTGLWLAIKYIKRKSRKVKKRDICQKEK